MLLISGFLIIKLFNYALFLSVALVKKHFQKNLVSNFDWKTVRPYLNYRLKIWWFILGKKEYKVKLTIKNKTTNETRTFIIPFLYGDNEVSTRKWADCFFSILTEVHHLGFLAYRMDLRNQRCCPMNRMWCHKCSIGYVAACQRSYIVGLGKAL